MHWTSSSSLSSSESFVPIHSPSLTFTNLYSPSSVLEFGISILTASLVAFRPLIKYMPFGSHGRSSSPGGHTGEGSRGPGVSGSNDFEMSRRKYVHVSDPNRVDSDDGDSQRNILPDADNGIDWKKADATVTPKDK